MKSKTNIRRHLKTVGLLLAGFAAGSTFWIVSPKGNVQVPAYHAYEVVDGDTFKITEHQLVRLSGIDSPESGRCGSEEAKRELSKFIVGKPIYIS